MRDPGMVSGATRTVFVRMDVRNPGWGVQRRVDSLLPMALPTGCPVKCLRNRSGTHIANLKVAAGINALRCLQARSLVAC